MEHTKIDEYLKNLREEGYFFYTKEELLEVYEKMVYSFVKEGYNGIVVEFDSDMEFWEIINNIKKIIEENKLIGTGCKEFINKFKVIDDRLINSSHSVEGPKGLPWWYYQVLKKGSKVYAEDVKLTYGIDIEVIE